MLNWSPYNAQNIKGKYLFRFLAEERLLYFLNTGNLWFSRADQFGDKMECVSLNDLPVIGRPNFEKIEARKKKHLICCFHEGTTETIALWDTYSTNDVLRRRYALRFCRRELIFLLEKAKVINFEKGLIEKNFVGSLVHGKVRYKTLLNSQGSKSSVLRVAFRKERAFSYEKEYRFDIKLKHPFKTEGVPYYIGEPEKIPFVISVNPLLEKDEYSNAVAKLEDLGLKDRYEESVLAKWLKPELW